MEVIMKLKQIMAVLRQFTAFLQPFHSCFVNKRSIQHLSTYCKGLMSNLKRKSAEPIALASGTAVRTFQQFLATANWDHEQMRNLIQQRIAERINSSSSQNKDDLGTIGIIDETSVVKKGNKTPGVQRQYLGCVGKVENGIVTVHLACVLNTFKSIIDSALFLPKSWSEDRDRCKEAGIPDDLTHKSKTQLALEQIQTAISNGLTFNWLTFDEGYGKSPAFLFELEKMGQHYVAEVPKSFACWAQPFQNHAKSSSSSSSSNNECRKKKPLSIKKACNICRFSPSFNQQNWQTVKLKRQTQGPQKWRIKAAQVYLKDNSGQPTQRRYWLIFAWQKDSNRYKYFISNAAEDVSVSTLLNVAFTRWNVEQSFRFVKSELGFGHFEGRHYNGLIRHMTLCSLVMLFLAEITAEQAAFSPSGDNGADVSLFQRVVSAVA
jgi:SRSO17 transposase